MAGAWVTKWRTLRRRRRDSHRSSSSIRRAWNSRWPSRSRGRLPRSSASGNSTWSAPRHRRFPKTCCRGRPHCWAARWPATSLRHELVDGRLQFDSPQFAGAVTATLRLIGSPQIVTVRASAYPAAAARPAACPGRADRARRRHACLPRPVRRTEIQTKLAAGRDRSAGRRLRRPGVSRTATISSSSSAGWPMRSAARPAARGPWSTPASRPTNCRSARPARSSPRSCTSRWASPAPCSIWPA